MHLKRFDNMFIMIQRFFLAFEKSICFGYVQEAFQIVITWLRNQSKDALGGRGHVWMQGCAIKN
jgi:hypothetical protein